MGKIFAEIKLINDDDISLSRRGAIAETDVRQMVVDALVDTGADRLVITESIKRQLGLQTKEKILVKLANSEIVECERVGPVDIVFKNRSTCCYALVLPSAQSVLLGAIPLEDMDLVVDLTNKQLTLPPDRPYIAMTELY